MHQTIKYEEFNPLFTVEGYEQSIIDLNETWDRNEAAGTLNRDGGFVYIVEFCGVYKIGRAKEVQKRIKDFSPTILPFDFNLVLSVPCISSTACEDSLHRQFQKDRFRGEWFNFTPLKLAEAKFWCVLNSVMVRPFNWEWEMQAIEEDMIEWTPKYKRRVERELVKYRLRNDKG